VQAILGTHKHEEEEALDEKLGVLPLKRLLEKPVNFEG